MNDSGSAPILVDFKDLVCVILKKSGAILAVALVFSVLAVCVPVMHRDSSTATVSYNTLDTSVKLRGESDEAYQSRIMNVEIAMSSVNEINLINNNITLLNEYYENSLLMNLDPSNTACSQIRVVLQIDNDSSQYEIENDLFTCIYDVLYGEYLDSLAEEYGYDSESLRELISCDILSSLTDNDLDDDSCVTPAFVIRIIGESTDFTDNVADSIVSELYNFSESTHNLMIVRRQSEVSFNEDVLNSQMTISTKISNEVVRVNQLNTTLDGIAKSLGYANRNVFFEPSSAVVTSGGGGVSKTTYIKYAGAGFILGFIFAAAYVALGYIWGRKIVSQRQFFVLFDEVAKVGVCKPQGKRSAFTEFLDKKTSDDSGLSAEDTNKIIRANLDNLAAGRILITGTSDDKAVLEAVKSLGVAGDVKLDLFKNPEILKSASEYDGIVVAEKRGSSEKKAIREELRLLENSGTKIVGAIIV